MGWRRRKPAGQAVPAASDAFADTDAADAAGGGDGEMGSGRHSRCQGSLQGVQCSCGSSSLPPPSYYCGEIGYAPLSPQAPERRHPPSASRRCTPRQQRRGPETMAPALPPTLPPTPPRVPRRHRPAPLAVTPSYCRGGTRDDGCAANSTPPSIARSTRRRRSSSGGLSSPLRLMSPGVAAGGTKRSGPAWALTCAVAATAALTVGGALSSSTSAEPAEFPREAMGAGAVGGKMVSLTPPPPPPSSSSPLSAASASLAGRVGRGIGDKMRSTSSSSLFFKSIDRDGDGTVRSSELADFVTRKIGGSAFDADDEVEEGVSNAMAAIDGDNDGGLDPGDMFAYWMKLESLLTADEVAEWVVHAVQLPESVGNIFKENVVTGYDFPELVENDGEALRSELGIEKQSFRKKIVRHIHARMLGVGTIPTAPPAFGHKLESCSAASLWWGKSSAKGFPVHGYRVQRRAVDLIGGGGGGGDSSQRLAAKNANASGAAVDSCRAAEERGLGNNESSGGEQCSAGPEATGSAYDNSSSGSSGSTSSLSSAPSASDWVTVYHGFELDFVDPGLEYGHNYVYRVQAWNSVGRSEWTLQDMSKSLKKLKCTTRPAAVPASAARSFLADNASIGGSFYSGNDVGWWPWSILSGSYFVVNFLVLFVRAVFTLTAVAAAIMRIKRASAKSTLSADVSVEPVFPWLWRGINALSVRAVGVEVLPRSILGGPSAQGGGRGKGGSSYYDKEINAVGLHGYNNCSSVDSDDGGGSDRARPVNRRVMFRRMKSHSTGNLAMMDSQKKVLSGTPTAAPKILRNKQRGRVLSEDSPSTPKASGSASFDSDPPSVITTTPKSSTAAPKSSSLFLRKLSRGTSHGDADERAESKHEDEDEALTGKAVGSTPEATSIRTLSTREGSSSATEDDEPSEDYSSDERLAAVAPHKMDFSDRRRSSADDCCLVYYEDDHTRCNSCRKSYKFPKRFKHHCARCMSTFCHKHGRTTHSNLVSCRVPGNCVCDVCLEIEAFNNNNSDRSGRSGNGSLRGEEGGGLAPIPGGTTTKPSKRWKKR